MADQTGGVMKTYALLIGSAFVVAGVAPPANAADANACLATIPSGATLGEPFPASENWYGSETLAVQLRPDGVWRGMGPANRYRDKLFWWSYGIRPGAETGLVVKGRRLDGDAPAADISRATNAHSPSLGGWTMLVAVEFPSSGCWEITGDYLGQKLAFVVNVPAE
jgi:hypothetical protein